MIGVIGEDRYLQLAEAASEGAIFLDRVMPEWFWEVDVEQLNMGNGIHSYFKGGCVLAQLNPNHEYSSVSFGLFSMDDFELGFANYVCSVPMYSILTQLWQDEIHNRRYIAWGGEL